MGGGGEEVVPPQIEIETEATEREFPPSFPPFNARQGREHCNGRGIRKLLPINPFFAPLLLDVTSIKIRP